MFKICLNMIVKNESKTIVRLLSSVIDIIDTFVIVDTGSDDNTVKIIQKFFSKYNRIKGLIITKDFRDFSSNRNEALRYCQGFGDYILLLDADHVLDFQLDKNLFNHLLKDNLDAYQILQENKDYSCQNIRLVKNNNSFIYKGLTHEVLTPLKSSTIGTLDKSKIRILDMADGGSRNLKIKRDIELLNKEIALDKNNSRAYFYLANTYFNIKFFKLAKKYYLKTIMLSDWNEELFFSYYRIGLIEIENKDYIIAIQNLLEAYNQNPDRCENLYFLRELYRHYQKDNLEELVNKLISTNLKKETSGFLFHNKRIYKKL